MSKRSRIITLIIIVALTVYAGVSLYNFWGDHVEAMKMLDEVKENITILQQQIDDLEYMLQNINNPDVISKLAEELGYVFPDELIISDG